MAHRFTKVSEEEIVAINEAAFFYPSDLVNSKTTIPPEGGFPLSHNFYVHTDVNFNWLYVRKLK